MTTYNFEEILDSFKISGKITPFGSGHINDTFLIESGEKKYTLQRINSDVFKTPADVMSNIIAVTQHIKDKVKTNGGDVTREVLNFLPAQDGNYFYKDSTGNYFRVYAFIDDVVTYDIVEKPSDFYHSAKAFGKFQKLLSDFPADQLHETLPNFHNTKARFENLKKAVLENKSGRLNNVRGEVEFFFEREADTGIVLDAIRAGEVPVRVTHNDTKLNNVLIDKQSGEAICVIDLDTVMPGSLLYDYGDSLRFGTNTAAEDETDLSLVSCSLEYFEAYTKGFLEELSDCLTKRETELLAFSAKLLTLECGMRFLSDYLDGDTYFKIHRENHNLDRARTQIKLVSDMEAKLDQMQEIIKRYLNP